MRDIFVSDVRDIHYELRFSNQNGIEWTERNWDEM